jgi:two-component system, OmpR family, response regulator QseB
MKILLVEDDPMLGASLQDALRGECHAVDWIRLGAEVRPMLGAAEYDLLILDLGLPDGDGVEYLRTLRQSGYGLPVLILSARDGIDARVCGLDAGADDYLLKPFDLGELSARLRALGRRSGSSRAGAQGQILQCGRIQLDLQGFTASLDDAPIALARREFMLLELLMRRPGQVFTRQQIEQSLYSWGEEIGSNAVEVHVHHLRRKLGNDILVTIRGIGYRLGDLK